MIHHLLNRWHRIRYSIELGTARARLALPNFSKPKAHSLSKPLVVSLTSFPPRFHSLAPTLRSLLRQTVKADHTVLWIATSDADFLPSKVLKLQSEGLEIRYTEDTKSYKKILPSLQAFPSAYVCTADDDIYYWPSWLEELVNKVEEGGVLVPCHRAHEITNDLDGAIKPYREWHMEVGSDANPRFLFPTGGGGVLFPPGILRHNSEDLKAALELCPHSDDVWLYWIAKRNGARFKTLGNGHRLLYRPSSDVQNLWSLNQNGEGNDVPIQKMIDKYGFLNSSAR